MSLIKTRFRTCGVIVAWLAMAQTVAEAQTLTAIDPAAGPAAGINNNGDVILGGHIWSAGTLTALGDGYFIGTGGPFPDPIPMTGGVAINNSGEVAGSIQGHAAIRRANGSISDIGVLPGADPTHSGSVATGISDNGVMVGSGGLAGNLWGWYATPGSPLVRLNPPAPGPGVPNPSSEVFGINSAGVATGYFNRDSGEIRHVAFSYGTTNDGWKEFGQGIGYAINGSSTVTGVLVFEGFAACGQAFEADTFVGGSHNLRTLGGSCSQGYAINDNGFIGGTSEISVGSTLKHAFFYNGAMQDLNDLIAANDPLKASVTLTEIRGIAVNNLVVANGFDTSAPTLRRAYVIQAPQVYLQGGQLNFGPLEVGTTSATQTIVLSNEGADPVTLGAVTRSGDFAQTNNCAGSLAAHASCAFTVTFSPTTGGIHEGRIQIIVDGLPIRAQPRGVATMHATLSTSATALRAGVPFTLSWQATAGSSCAGIGNDIPGTSAGTSWAQPKGAMGSMEVVPNQAGTFNFAVRCTSNGVTVDSNTVTLNATWPDVTATLTPSATSISSGSSVTLTWTSAFADSCTAVGGGANDNWPGARTLNGSLVVLEPSAVSVAIPLTFTLTCTSNGSGRAATAQTIVTLNPAAPSGSPSSSSSSSSSGGGGSLDAMMLAGLGSLLVFVQVRRRRMAALVN